LLPIGRLSEAFGLDGGGGQPPPLTGKLYELGRLEEVKVVTRSPLVNQRRDHYRVTTVSWLCQPREPYTNTLPRRASRRRPIHKRSEKLRAPSELETLNE